jgi:hypothetical protein
MCLLETVSGEAMQKYCAREAKASLPSHFALHCWSQSKSKFSDFAGSRLQPAVKWHVLVVGPAGNKCIAARSASESHARASALTLSGRVVRRPREFSFYSTSDSAGFQPNTKLALRRWTPTQQPP